MMVCLAIAADHSQMMMSFWLAYARLPMRNPPDVADSVAQDGRIPGVGSNFISVDFILHIVYIRP